MSTTLQVNPPLNDQSGWDQEPYFSTIQLADINGDKKAELVARGVAGIRVWQFDQQWQEHGSVLPLSDAAGWNGKPYYATIQFADVDGDGKAELIARSVAGLQIWKFEQGWQVVGTTLTDLSDSSGWNQEPYYSTIQFADLDGDGKAELIARGIAGVMVWKFAPSGWQKLPGVLPLSDADRWNEKPYYSTMQCADVDGDGKAELIARTGSGVRVWKFDQGWQVIGTMLTDLSDSAGWNQEPYYSTMQCADIDGDGKAELIARGSAGVRLWKFDSSGWQPLGAVLPLNDASGWNQPQYYSTLRAIDVNGDGKAELIARGSAGILVWTWKQDSWQSFETLPALNDAAGWNRKQYYSTLQFANIDGNGKLAVVARGSAGIHTHFIRGAKNGAFNAEVQDTSNALTDFDLCLAIAQQAINSQMKFAWKAWKVRKNIGRTIEIFKPVKTETGTKPSKYGLSVVLAEPHLDLSVQNVKLGQVKVTLTLTSGTVKYLDEATEEAATYPVSNWKISFVTDLSKKTVDTKILAAIDAVSAEAAQTLIQQSGLPESVFSIEFLFLKLTNVNCLLLDNKNVEIPADVPDAAKERALSSLNALLQGEMGEFMLGTVVRRNKDQATPTFAMTDFVFGVHANSEVAEASTLNYLGMVSQHPLPANLDTARIKLADAWVQPEQLDGTDSMVSGVMAISKAVFMDQYLIPKFTKLIGKAPISKQLSWTFFDDSDNKWEENDIIKRKWSKGRDWALTLAIVPGKNQIQISGRVASYFNMDGHDYVTDSRTEWIHVAGHQNFSGSIQFAGKGSATDFELAATVTNEFAGLVVDKRETKGGAKVLTSFQKAFNGSTFEEGLKNGQQEDVNNISAWLDQVLKNVGLDLSQHAFIPPGGGVFTFQNPRFSKAGDLLFDVIYQAP